MLEKHIEVYTIDGQKVYDNDGFTLGMTRAENSGIIYEPEGLDFWTDPISNKVYLVMGMISQKGLFSIQNQIVGVEYNPIKKIFSGDSIEKKTFSSRNELENSHAEFISNGECVYNQ